MSFLIRGVTQLVTKIGKMVEVLAAASAGKVNISSQEPYTNFVIHGTRPHMIYPVNALALYNERTGFGPVAQAMHPGTKPNDFVERAVAKARPLLVKEYTMMLGDGLVFGAVRAEAAKVVVGETLIKILREEAPKDTGNLAKGLGLVSGIGDVL